MKRFSKHSFTLVEALVSILILSFSVIAILSLISVSAEMADLLDQRQMALQLATKHIQKLREQEFDQLPLYAEDHVKINADGEYDPEGEFARSTEVVVASADSYSVSVEVECHGGYLHKKVNVELATILADYSKIR